MNGQQLVSGESLIVVESYDSAKLLMLRSFSQPLY